MPHAAPRAGAAAGAASAAAAARLSPRTVVAATVAAAAVIAAAGDANAVARLLTTALLACCALINYAAFSGAATRAPGWRPAYAAFGALPAAAAVALCFGLLWMQAWYARAHTHMHFPYGPPHSTYA